MLAEGLGIRNSPGKYKNRKQVLLIYRTRLGLLPALCRPYTYLLADSIHGKTTKSRTIWPLHQFPEEMLMIHSLSLINLFVRDMGVSRQFYCEILGIPLSIHTAAEEDKYVELDIDGPRIFLHWTPPDTSVEYRNRGLELYLRIDDADVMARRLSEKGIELKTPVYDVGWRPWRCLQVEDPDGYTLFLVSRQNANPAS
jgi:predicted enzyme related to lactoylglutathione lyase